MSILLITTLNQLIPKSLQTDITDYSITSVTQTKKESGCKNNLNVLYVCALVVFHSL